MNTQTIQTIISTVAGCMIFVGGYLFISKKDRLENERMKKKDKEDAEHQHNQDAKGLMDAMNEFIKNAYVRISGQDAEITALKFKLEVCNKQHIQSDQEWNRKYNELLEKFEALQKDFDKLKQAS